MSLMNISSVSVNTVVNNLSAIYIRLIRQGKKLFSVPSAFLWGPPGIGKSEAVSEIAKRIEGQTGKKVRVTDVRLLLFSPIDLRGIPKADVSHQFTEWLRPKLFDFSSDDDVINILFLDELTACSASVQAAAYQITLDRSVGEHKLPDNTIIIAAGNRTSDKSVAYRMPNALANRLLHLQVEVDFHSWKQWAVNNGIHPYVLGYLNYDTSKLYKEPEGKDDVAFPTPRTWTFVSNLLKAGGENYEKGIPGYLYPLITGCVGIGTAMEFMAWCEVYKELPSVEDIFNGKDVDYPKRQDVLFALISSMTNLIFEAVRRDEKGEDGGISAFELEMACRYASKFPGDFAACFYRNLLDMEGLRHVLVGVPAFLGWARKNKIRME